MSTSERKKAVPAAAAIRCLSINLCDLVLVDAASHNKSLINCFNQITTTALPAMHPRMFVAVSVANVISQTKLTVVVLNPIGEQLLEVGVDAIAPDPTQVSDFVVDIRGLKLSEAGVYSVQLRHQSDIVAERQFAVLVSGGQTFPNRSNVN